MITNASQAKLDYSISLPDVSAAVSLFLQPVDVVVITTQMISGYPSRLEQVIHTQVSKQAFTAEQLSIKDVGDRSWSWFLIHSLPDLQVKTGDKIKFNDEMFKIMAKRDFKEYGYIEYEAIKDFT